jgi:hypothetical protein
MSSTRDRGTRAAAFVMISLLIAVIAGVVLYFRFAEPNSTGVPLLAGCALVAFAFALLSVRLTISHRKSLKNQRQYGMPPGRVLHAMELRQWLTLTVGIAFLAVATGAATGLRVVTTANAGPVVVQPTATLPVATEQPVIEASSEPTGEPVTEEPTPTDSIEPSPAETTDGPTDAPVDTPATKYLDGEDTLEGGFDAEPVTFSAKRFPRGLSFTCTSATSSSLQWNVAGYRTFTAVAGVDDRTQAAFGEVVEFLFYDQDGHQLNAKPLEVSMGHSRAVSLKLTNVVSLRMTCSSRDSKTGQQHSTRSSLGDPVITQ